MMYVFLDFEFTTFKTKKKNIKKKQEIISIGAIKTNDYGDIIDKYYTLISPTENSILTDYCINLTKITQNSLDNANTLDIEIYDFYNWIYNNTKNKKIKILTWGALDRIILNNELSRKHINLSFPIINIQYEISNFITNNKNKTLSLKDAKSFFDMPQYVTHNSLNDAEDLYNVYFWYKTYKKIRFSKDHINIKVNKRI